MGTKGPGEKLTVNEGNISVSVYDAFGGPALKLINPYESASPIGQISALGRFSTNLFGESISAREINIMANITVIKLGTVGQQNTSLYTDSLPRLTVLGSNGNVGIGTTSPGQLLHLLSGSTTATALSLQNTSAGGLNYILYSTGSGASTGAGVFTIHDGTAHQFVIKAGNVGIGTTSPAVAKLQVAGDAAVRKGDKLLLDSDDGTADTYVMRNTGATTVSWFVDGTEIAILRKQTEVR